MGFRLFIEHGPQTGREFMFEETPVAIGRGSDCELLLNETGVSRRHAQIVSGHLGYVIEDLGSSNGTKVDGQRISRHDLSTDEMIEVGPVILRFESMNETKTTGPDEDSEALGEGDHEPTRIVPRASAQAAIRPRSSGGAGPRDLATLSAGATGKMLQVREAVPLEDDADLATQPKMERITDVRRKLVYVMLFACVCLGSYALYRSRNSASSELLPVEPTELSSDRVEFSFGSGPNVDYVHDDQKAFVFRYASPAKYVAVLNFQSENIAANEVSVSLNGSEIDHLPADTTNVSARVNSILLPSRLLKRGDPNTIIFDNVNNPPNKDAWRIWNLSVEAIVLPDVAPSELIAQAGKDYDMATNLFDRRTLGSQNTYHAWNLFRQTWLFLEGLPDPKPELYTQAREQMKKAQAELDRLCNQLLLQARSEYNHKQFEEARSSLDHVKDYFPSRDQMCLRRAEVEKTNWNL